MRCICRHDLSATGKIPVLCTDTKNIGISAYSTYLRPTAKWQVVAALNRACRRAGVASSQELQLSGVPKIAPKPFAG